MKAVYIRISTPNQNIERQLKQDKTIVPYIDICSGAVPFSERKNGSLMMRNKKLTEIEVKEISRLGRNLKDILNTIEYFINNGVDIRIENLGINLMVDGKISPMANLIVSMFGAIAEHERNIIKERTQEGREIAKAKGVFKGRKRGAVSNINQKNEMAITWMQSKLNEGVSISQISRESYSLLDKGISRTRIYDYLKKGLIKQVGCSNEDKLKKFLKEKPIVNM